MSEDLSILSRAARPADRVLSYGPQPQQLAELYASAAPQRRPLVVLIHGGFWRPQYDRVHLRPMAEALAAAGWTVALIEYARVPGDPDATVSDVTLAVRRCVTLDDRPDDRVIVMGHSAGGHLALWAAAAPANAASIPAPASTPAAASRSGPASPAPVGHPALPLVAAIGLGPAADLQLADELNLGDGAARAFVGADPVTRPDLDPRRLPTPGLPVTLIHGTGDDIVPLAVSESYAGAHPAARLVRVTGAGHFALIDPQSPAWSTVLAELERAAGAA